MGRLPIPRDPPDKSLKAPAGGSRSVVIPVLSRLAIALLASAPLAGAADDFATVATPLLQKYCYECHGEKKQKGGIEVHHLDSTEAAPRA